jgi:hypothetical protein
MARPTGCIAAAAILGLTVSVASAQTTGPRPVLTSPSSTPQFQQAKLTAGAIRGTVLDERGVPLGDAMVSALSPLSSRMVTTDARGHFRIDALPTGVYVLRIHRNGFMSARREGVRVNASGANTDVDAIRLRRDEGGPGARPILAAGLDAPGGDSTSGDSGDNHSEVAWRLRHIKRSVLKDDGEVVSVLDANADEPLPAPTGSLFGRAVDNATSFFTATPFSGEVNLLTTSAVRDGSLLPLDFIPRGVAYLSIGAPAASGRWDVRASMSQSDMSAWILAGSFTSRDASPHVYNFGVTYSTQQYQNQRARPLLALGGASTADDTRNVGEMYGADHWTITPLVAVDYGARYSHYDYLTDRSLFSPRVGLTVTPYAGTHLTARISQRMVAPGAEEFLAPATVGPWLPPERTFEPLGDEGFRVERIRTFDIGVNHELGGACVVGVRRIEQRVGDQMVTLFGLPVEGGPGTPGHYFVASAGAVDASGWGFSLGSLPSQRVRGSIDYSVTRADWISRGDMAAIALWAPSAVRPRTEDVHDLTTSLETEVPLTATRVFVFYKVNTAFAHGDDPTRPTLDYRFDVQVNQALPFMPFSRSARWEVLVGMRNVFRDPSESGSVYDELLVVRPPKRVVGGVLVRF